jgi:hypothetical protein
MARETRHIVQPYRVDAKNRLVPAEALQARNGAAARERAKTLYESGRYSGVDAFTVSGDADLGEYGEPRFHIRLGRVPELEG